ncbi:hypothetical protein G3I21_26080, partial [Streptomyces bauhiniae]|nr:hypothetical protein [Streptomyces bauhiniae]
MSTEARRAPFPPRPGHDPAPADAEPQVEDEPSVFAPRRPLERPRETRPPVPEARITTPPPPPPASARFPDAPPAPIPAETTTRPRPVPADPEPAVPVPPPPA